MTDPPSAIAKLSPDDDVGSFDCGLEELNRWLRRFAIVNQQAGSAQVYAMRRGRRVIGYYALAAGSVERATAPERVAKGTARHPVPVIILARLAVDTREQGRGIGRALLKDAMLRTADVIGVRAVLVHAKDASARAFYERFDFEPSPFDPLQLFLVIKDLQRALRASTPDPPRR